MAIPGTSIHLVFGSTTLIVVYPAAATESRVQPRTIYDWEIPAPKAFDKRIGKAAPRYIFPVAKAGTCHMAAQRSIRNKRYHHSSARTGTAHRQFFCCEAFEQGLTTMLYLLREKSDGISSSDSETGIDANHPWVMPGVKCPACGAWATTGIQYPEISLEGYPRLGELIPRPIARPEFNCLRDDLAGWLNFKWPIHPGTSFGKLTGKARRSSGDFEFLNPWTILMKPAAKEKLLAAGLVLPAFADTDLHSRQGPLQYLEPSIKPELHLAMAEGKPCHECGRRNVKWPDKIMLQPTGIASDLARIEELPTAIVCTDLFKQLVESLDARNLMFEPLEIA